MIQTFVPGIPQPQGSKNAYVRGNRAVLVEANKKLPAWRQIVTEKLEAANVSCAPLQGAVDAQIIFFMPRPKSVTRLLPTVKPDIDKMIRAILDCGTKAGIYNDDSQVIEIVAHKLYADAEQPAGALITFGEYFGVSFDN
jgi:crossover junction endodeoxyribonuclease RusA